MFFVSLSRYIKRVGLNLEVPGGTRVIDATGKLVMPGKYNFLDFSNKL